MSHVVEILFKNLGPMYCQITYVIDTSLHIFQSVLDDVWNAG